jgi:hypothetical protein
MFIQRVCGGRYKGKTKLVTGISRYLPVREKVAIGRALS